MTDIANIVAESFNKMALQMLAFAICGVLGFVVVYFIVKAFSRSHQFAKFVGLMAMLASFYFSWKVIFLQ
ncbi:hypothetical protein PB01_08165 [Psychrobacillus glaciei]|uniref:Uncharacterized protein n=1 Tax=Psychrobacillus glaciei TaxID=2283160 RepID=A0A5J6SLY9_9BACI|nr:hypothetical protein [Psychrobacillus glaciei]QFF98809.1 hypothetical protein PB01_08165 [Psychrobacillus glaciei]